MTFKNLFLQIICANNFNQTWQKASLHGWKSNFYHPSPRGDDKEDNSMKTWDDTKRFLVSKKRRAAPFFHGEMSYM